NHAHVSTPTVRIPKVSATARALARRSQAGSVRSRRGVYSRAMVLPHIHVSAVVFRDAQGQVLTVRKRGTEKFMFPGGKPELGESALDTAIREVKEEIGIGVEPKQLTQIGVYEAPAANE